MVALPDCVTRGLAKPPVVDESGVVSPPVPPPDVPVALDQAVRAPNWRSKFQVSVDIFDCAATVCFCVANSCCAARSADCC